MSTIAGSATSRGFARVARRVCAPAITASLVAGTFLLWWWLAASGSVHPVVLPGPDAVWQSLVDVVARESFRRHLRETSLSILVGFTVGSVLAIGVALACDRFAVVRRLATPYMVAFQALPKVVLLPLLFAWFGMGYRATTAMVVLVVFFPVYLSTLTGLAIADPDGTRLLTSLGATRGQRFRYHQAPSALPLVFTGMKISVNFAVAAALAAELLGARHGLGFLIANSGNFLRIDELYATVVIAGLFAGAFYLAFELIDRKVVYWRPRGNRR